MIWNRYKKYGSYHVAKGYHQKIVPVTAHRNSFVSGIIDQRECQQRHVCHTVLKTRGEEETVPSLTNLVAAARELREKEGSTRQ